MVFQTTNKKGEIDLIDVHTHVLPGVDDGSPDLETSIELIKYELKQGVTDIFVTPHYIKYRDYLSSFEDNKKVFDLLIREIKKQKIEINLHLGNEIYFDRHTILNLENKIVTPLGDSNYVLLEFSLYEKTEDIGEAIHNIKSKGYVPIIAHPERYPYINDIKDYMVMKKMGAMIQINCSAINGEYGKKIKKMVLNLIKNNLVDFVASDIHDFRLSSLLDAFNIVENLFGKEIATHIFCNKCVLK